MKYFETYKDFIGKGRSNKATYLDEDWVIKSPLKKWEKKGDDYDPDENMKEIINDFDRHIKFMKQYPSIFPEVKKLDKYRAAVQKMDINKAYDEITHIYNLLPIDIKNIIPKEELLKYTYNYLNDKYPNKSGEIMEILKTSDAISKKWHDFLLLLNTDMKKELGFLLDLYPRNIGLDKQGNIKLIDF